MAPPDCRPHPLWAIPVGILGAALHLPSLRGPFVFDDAGQLARNTWQGGLSALPQRLGRDFLSRGLTQASYLLNYAWGKESPLGYHAVNLLAQGAAVASLFLLARCLSRESRSFPFFCAAWFAALPAGAESTSYVSGRAGLLAGLVSLATSAWAASMARRPSTPGRAWGILAVIAAGTLLSAGCKETGWMTPILAALCVLAADGRPWRERWTAWRRPLTVGAACGLAAAVFFVQARGGIDALLNRKPIGMLAGHWVAQAGIWGAEYFPRWLVPFGPWAPCADMALPSAPPAGGLAILALSSLWVWRRPFGRLTAGWVLVAALPSSLVPLLDPAAERHTYLASAGAALTAGACLAGASATRAGRWFAAALLLFLATITWARSGIWGSEARFWRDTLRKSPGKARAAYNYGLCRHGQERYESALHWYRRSVLIQPGRALTFSAMAFSQLRLGDLHAAAAAFAQANRLETEAILAGDQPERHRGMLALDSYNRTRILIALGRRDEAKAACAEALRWVPRDPVLREAARELGLP